MGVLLLIENTEPAYKNTDFVPVFSSHCSQNKTLNHICIISLQKILRLVKEKKGVIKKDKYRGRMTENVSLRATTRTFPSQPLEALRTLPSHIETLHMQLPPMLPAAPSDLSFREVIIDNKIHTHMNHYAKHFPKHCITNLFLINIQIFWPFLRI